MSNSNILGLPPLNPDSGFGFDSLQTNPDNHPRSRGEIKEINQDALKRRVVIDAVAGNSEYAIRRAVDMDQKAFAYYFAGAQAIVEMNEEAQGKPYQKICEAMSMRMVQVMARHTLGYLDAGALRIAYEVNRLPQPDEPKSWLAQIFG